MAAYVFSKINIDYAGLYADAYSDMSDCDIKLLPKVYDSIVSSLLPDWLSWCGDELLAEKGLVTVKCNGGVKVLGNGQLTKKLTVKADKFSASAKSAIEAAGGVAEVIE